MAFKLVIEEVSRILLPYGFKRRGQIYRGTSQGNVQIVHLQKSLSNSASVTRFTINIGIFSNRLAELSFVEGREPGVWDAHVRLRIGDFLPTPYEKWWELTAESDGKLICQEIASLLTDSALPYLEAHSSDAALVALWSSGRSPGLTKGQRERNLSALNLASND
jgi:hypothetical protein